MAHTAGHRRAQMVNRQNRLKAKAGKRKISVRKRVQEKNRINRTTATNRRIAANRKRATTRKRRR